VTAAAGQFGNFVLMPLRPAMFSQRSASVDHPVTAFRCPIEMSIGRPGDLRDDFVAEIADLQERADQTARTVAACAVTERAQDGSVSVTVGPGGQLLDISFGARASTLPPRQLSAVAMKLAGQAQRRVSAEVLTAFGGLVRDRPDAMELLTGFLPTTNDSRSPGASRPSRPGSPSRRQQDRNP
jgi:hypothetical protein